VRIVELTAYHVRIPLRKPVQHASHTRHFSDNVVVRAVLQDGTIGFGEGVPREYVTGETIDSVMALLARSDLAAQVRLCKQFDQAVHLAEDVRLPAQPDDERGCQGNAARCAIELAILDAFGRHFGEPLSEVTRLTAGDLFQPRPHVRYSGAITSAASGLKVRLAAWRQRVFRFQDVKVKVGISGHDDAGRLRVIRSILGPRRNIRVDANEAWGTEEVIRRITELEPFGISSVEQPVHHDDVEALAEARRHIHVPIMLDESLCSRVDAERAVQRGLCDLFNIRLAKCGGLIPSLRLAQFARQNGIGYQLGCQIGESALLSAAGRHFATSVTGLRFVEGSYDRHLVCETLADQDITFRWGGWADPLPGPGLGVRVDLQALERVTIRKEPLLG
jgi:muconate cycloisomerase